MSENPIGKNNWEYTFSLNLLGYEYQFGELTNLLLRFEDELVKVLVQFLVGQVDRELLKRIVLNGKMEKKTN